MREITITKNSSCNVLYKYDIFHDTLPYENIHVPSIGLP